jgi:hypothetical protein
MDLSLYLVWPSLYLVWPSLDLGGLLLDSVVKRRTRNLDSRLAGEVLRCRTTLFRPIYHSIVGVKRRPVGKGGLTMMFV